MQRRKISPLCMENLEWVNPRIFKDLKCYVDNGKHTNSGFIKLLPEFRPPIFSQSFVLFMEINICLV